MEIYSLLVIGTESKVKSKILGWYHYKNKGQIGTLNPSEMCQEISSHSAGKKVIGNLPNGTKMVKNIYILNCIHFLK